FGPSTLDTEPTPAAIGGRLSGSVRARVATLPEAGFRLTLSCINLTVSGSGRNRTTRETILWQEEQSVPADRVETDAEISRIPVLFPIPPDGRATDDADFRSRILWRLEVTADLPGVDYQERFEVPVARALAGNSAGRAPAVDDTVPPDPIAGRPAAATIAVRPASEGGTLFLFRAARNPMPAFASALFFLLFSGSTGFLFWMTRVFPFPSLPGLFVLGFVAVFGAFDLLLFWFVLLTWLGVTRVVAASGILTIDSGILGLRRRRSIESAEIASITTSIGMQVGTTPYYDIKVTGRDGRRYIAGGMLRSKREAEWLAAEMSRCLA
ncbi:MAG TPA: hypothetical protein VFT43_04470, partial [Candidatus Polarisedimenticolia bacterium]|nr:hypothetical protein [Candidatus Polarisedimenticolia bacterium]